MRLLRWSAILLCVASILFCGWATYTYRQKQNSDIPSLISDCDLLEISVADGKEALMKGLSAHDKTDGDLTDQIMIASTSHFIEQGVVKVKYVVFDSHNNSATLTRKVKYVDYTSPHFALDTSPVYVKGASFDLLRYIQVEDALDGDISDHIRILSSAVSNYTTGTFPLVLSVSNSCGDTAQVELMVTYAEKEDLTADIRLREYILYLEEGADFDAEDARNQLVYAAAPGGQPIDFDRIEIGGALDPHTAGTYHLTYSYVDGNVRGQANLTVVVEKAGDAE